MKFTVIDNDKHAAGKKSQVLLYKDKWDDWFEFETKYYLTYVDNLGEKHGVGHLKIGQFQMAQGQRTPEIPTEFEELDERFFSLGQDDSYYVTLNNLGDSIRESILTGIKDVAKNEQVWRTAQKERVTRISLLRSVTITTVDTQFRRLANGGARLTEYRFLYTAPIVGKNTAPSLFLEVIVAPESNPPTNIHILIGRNGVGKTHLISNMTNCLLNGNNPSANYGTFSSGTVTRQTRRTGLFANLVSVAFSAFDLFEPSDQIDSARNINYSYLGLKRPKDSDSKLKPPKSPTILKNEFVTSVLACLEGAKYRRWKKALQMLDADPIFSDIDVGGIVEEYLKDRDALKERLGKLFNNLSSGHKIVLLTITHLVEKVEERTLVLMDEPEAHLHPPLLSAFIRVISDLLIDRNGVAIIATHSPVVLQEVPKSCVWKLRRKGSEAVLERLTTESFGENVGVLTREVFGLEVTHSGFHKLLSEIVSDSDSYEQAVDSFNGELGLEAKAIIQTLMLTKTPD